MNKAIRATLAMVIVAAVSPLTLAWQTHINGTAALGIDDALAITFDNDRNVVVAGVTEHTFTVDDFTVVKFDGATGAELWRQEINGAANGLDRALAITVDGAGNVLAAGFVVNSGATSDFTVIKFDGANGNELWRQSLNGSSSASDEARAIRVDSADNVIAAGFMSNSGGFRDFTVIKFDGTSGSELWRQSINGTANASDEARDIATDNAGNVIAVGGIQNTTTFTDFAIVKFDGATGQELWRRVISGATLNALDSASAIAVDAAGDAVVSGVIQSSFAVVKLDGVTGAELWRQLINGGSAEAFAVTLDQNNDVVAAGRLQNLFCCSEVGRRCWRRTVAAAPSPCGARVSGIARDVILGSRRQCGRLRRNRVRTR